MTTPPPTPEARERMTKMVALYQELLFAAGVEPKDQIIDLDFLQVLYETEDAQLQTLCDLTRRTALLVASYRTVDDVASYFRVRPKLIRQLAKWGVLHGRLSRRYGWLFTEKAIADFEARQTFYGLGDLREQELESWRRPA